MISKIKKSITRRTEPSYPARELKGGLSILKDKLAILLSGTEENFLHIGSCLQDFTAKSRELSAMSATLAALTSGEKVGDITDGLRGQLDKMSQYMGDGKEKSACNMEKLQNALKIIAGLDDICVDFEKITRMLQFVSVSIQVENARVDWDKTGFNTVANDVKTLAHSIETQSGNVQADSKALSTLVKNAISRTQELSKQQQSTTIDIIRDIQSSLEMIIAMNEKSSEVSTQAAARSSEIHNNIGDVVTSIQFHDITRQQIEHVRDTLNHVHERLEEAERDDQEEMPHDKKTELMGWISSVCNVQLSQLQNTRKELEGAVLSAIDNLRGISRNAAEMASDAQALSGGNTHSTGSSLLTQVDEGITTVIQLLKDNEAMEREISTSMSSTVHNISEFVSEIEAIGSKIKLIALNAQVQSACIGEEGKTFEVLSEEIQKLSVDARNNTTVVQKNLELITVEDEGPQTPTDEALTGDGDESEYDHMVNTFEDLLGSINLINREFVATMGRVTESGKTLGEEIEVFADQIVFHENMLQTIDEIVNGFSDIRDNIHRQFPDAVLPDKAVNLETLETSYTMRSERKVHRHATLRTTPVLVGAETGFSRKDDTDGHFDGDNVVLF